MRDGRKLLAFGAAAAVITVAAGGLAVHRQMPPEPAVRPRVQTQSQAQTQTPTQGAADRDGTPHAATARVPVTVYTTSWCPVCKRAKQWLAANDIPFTERDVEADPQAARDRRALTSDRGVPTFDVDGEIFVGFDRQELQRMIDNAKKRRL